MRVVTGSGWKKRVLKVLMLEGDEEFFYLQMIGAARGFRTSNKNTDEDTKMIYKLVKGKTVESCI